MAMHRFKSAFDNKFGRCTATERKSCLACDAEGKPACGELKKVMADAVPNQRSPIKEPASKGDTRGYISRLHQGLRLYLTPSLDGMMRTYDYLVSCLMAGANGSYPVAFRTAEQNARARGLSKNRWHTHIRKLKALGLIATIARHHVAPTDVVSTEAYIGLPLPDWAVELSETLHLLGRLKRSDTGKLEELEKRRAAVVAKVDAILGTAGRRTPRSPAPESTAVPSKKRPNRKWAGEL